MAWWLQEGVLYEGACGLHLQVLRLPYYTRLQISNWNQLAHTSQINYSPTATASLDRREFLSRTVHNGHSHRTAWWTGPEEPGVFCAKRFSICLRGQPRQQRRQPFLWIPACKCCPGKGLHHLFFMGSKSWESVKQNQVVKNRQSDSLAIAFLSTFTFHSSRYPITLLLARCVLF